jgi:hypothetical protein
MGLDLRIPLGLMFLAIGGLLEIYGLATWHSAIYERSLGENLNIIWGGVLLLFGGLMYGLGRRARWQDDPMNPRPWEEPVTEQPQRRGH